MIEIIPAIIPADFDDVRTRIALVRGIVPRVQIDTIDGVFAETPSWPYNRSDREFEKLLDAEEGLPYWQEIDAEVDLMVTEPERVLDDWIRAGVAGVIAHHGSTAVFADIVTECHERGVEIGYAIRPSTVLAEAKEALVLADFIQVMGNDTIGMGGMPLDERVYETLSQLRSLFPKKDIGVDIGVSTHTAPKLVAAGANRLAAGSAIYGSDSVEEAIEQLKEAAQRT